MVVSPFVTLVGVCSMAAGIVHAAAAGTHSGDAVSVWLFGLAAVAQVAVGAWLLSRPAAAMGRVAICTAVGINGVAVLAWVVSRTLGLPPFSTWGAPDAAGMQDSAAALLALLTVVAAAMALMSRRSLPPIVMPMAMMLAVVPMVVGVTADHEHGDSHHGSELAAHDHVATDVGHDDHASLAVTDGDHAAAHNVDVHDDGAHNEGAAHDGAHGDAALSDSAHGASHTASADGHHEGASSGEVNGHGSSADVHETHGGSTSGSTGGGHNHPPTTTTLGPGLAADPIFAGASTAGLTEAQLIAAKDLIVRTRADVTTRFATTAAAEAAGYSSIGDGRQVGGFEHYVHFGFISDGAILNPATVESLVYRNDGGGQKTLVSAMFILPFGRTMASVPEIAGHLTTWHDHQNLCWNGTRVVGTLQNGVCTSGVFRATPPMLHVWLVPHACGPFAGVESHGAGSCAHAH
jgi:hypothetical protein